MRLVSLLAAVCVLPALGCGASGEQEAAVAAAPPQGAAMMFDREGVPGPWWRYGGTFDTFEQDLGDCLARGKQARAGAEDPADAAYREFLECMQQQSWIRGLPPAPTAPAG